MPRARSVPGTAVPATFPNTAAWGAPGGAAVPAEFLHRSGHAKPNAAIANMWTWFSEGSSSYNSLQVDMNRRFSKGLALRGVYTFSKTLDDGDEVNATAAANAPALVSTPTTFDRTGDAQRTTSGTSE